MTARVYITTSWDDGHPSDARLADLLARHGLCGTFYVPRSFQRMRLLSPRQYLSMGEHVEVGAHTLDHPVLTRIDTPSAVREIVDSKAWVEDQTGLRCTMFCPPCGKHTKAHLQACIEAGYKGVRTVEGWSIDTPRHFGPLRVLPTTAQAMPPSAPRDLRNIAKRLSVRGLFAWLRFRREPDWPGVLQRFLDQTRRSGGVVHLWGHSWELNRFQQWEALEQALAAMGRACREGWACATTNGSLATANLPAESPSREAAETPSVITTSGAS